MTLIFIFLLILILFGCALYRRYLSRFSLDFKWYIKTLELPIVTLESNGRKFNFLVDSGSNKSHLKLGIADAMESSLVEDNKEGVITTGNGVVQQYGYYKVCFDLDKKLKISQIFEVMDLEETFANWGVPVHGILGVDFLTTYGYKLDFNRSIMYV